MQVAFTQGIIRGQLDPVNPSYLNKSGSYVDLVVAPTPTLAVVCDADRSYLITEAVSVSNAWGPFPGSDDYYLYWDVNKATGAITRGFSDVEPHVGSQPSSPATGQHWFNPSSGIMSYWNGSIWVQVIRLFAGKLLGGSTVEYYDFGSQVGMNDEVFAGYILHGANNVGVKDSTGRFVTTEQELKIKLGALSHPLSMETIVEHAIATESIPAFSMVSPGTDDHTIRLTDASSSDNAIGMVLVDVAEGESASLHTAGIVYNADWDWDPSDYGKPLWIADSGGLTTTRTGNPQCAGLVIWQKHILLDVDSSAAAIFSAIIAIVSADTHNDISNLQSAVASLSNTLSTQAAAASNTTSAVNAISTRLSNLVSVVSSETTARINGDASIDAAIAALSNVVSNRTSAIITNSSQMTAGDAAAMNAVSVVSAALASLSNTVSNRTSAIIDNSAQMTSADAALSNRISVLSAVVSSNKNTHSAAIAANSAAMTAGDLSVLAAALNAVSVSNNLISNATSAIVANSAQMTSADSTVLQAAMNAISALSATMANNDANIVSSVNALSAVVVDYHNMSATTNSTDSNQTYTAAQMRGGIIVRTTAVSAPRSDTTDTAANIVSSIPHCTVGSWYTFKVVNQSAQVITILNGANVTLVGPMTIAATSSRIFDVVVTNATVSSEAVTIYG